MIELTPLDVRNKRGDFKRLMRGYDPDEVDVFLELVAERMEALVRENIQYRERTATLQSQVTSATEREQAVQDALVTAQELRADIKAQSQREADHILREAETEARRLIAEADAEVRTKLRGAERRFDEARDALAEMERRRDRFLKEFRQLLQRELDVVDVEEQREPLEERTIELDLGADTSSAKVADAPAEAEPVEQVVPEEAAPDVAATTEEAAGDEEPTQELPVAAPRVPQVAEAQAAESPATTLSAPEESAGAEELDVAPQAPAVESGVTPVVADPAYRPDEPTVSLDQLGPDTPDDHSEAAATLEAEAFAEAGQPVEVTPPPDGLAVPRLEEVLAEAGAEFVESPPRDAAGEEIAPPPVRDVPTAGQEDTLLLYLDHPEERHK